MISNATSGKTCRCALPLVAPELASLVLLVCNADTLFCSQCSEVTVLKKIASKLMFSLFNPQLLSLVCPFSCKHSTPGSNYL